MLAADRPTERRAAWETVARPEGIPLYQLVPVRGPEGDVLTAYRGVQRADTREVVSVVSERYGLAQHRTVAEAVHAVGDALGRPEPDAGAPSYPRGRFASTPAAVVSKSSS